jgi:Flp pilus assembly protein TadG
MRWVKGRREDGVAAVLFAVVATVMFGMGALVIDAGALYQERRELQTGADAAALALAQICAKAPTPCTNGPELNAKAAVYAELNVSDLTASATASIDTSTKEVTVIAATPNNNQVPFHFAPIIGGATEGRASAKAKAGYGYPSQGNTLPLTFSLCEWQQMTGTPAVFPTAEKLIYFHQSATGKSGNADTGPCPVTPSGMDSDGVTTLTGGFGQLQQAPGVCYALISIDNWVLTSPGANPPSNPCMPADAIGKDVELPIFDKVDLTCPIDINKKCYHVYGFAMFHVTGLNLGGNGWSTDPKPCKSDERCLKGYFKSFSTTRTGVPNGPNLGLSVVYLIE